MNGFSLRLGLGISPIGGIIKIIPDIKQELTFRDKNTNLFKTSDLKTFKVKE